MITSFANEYWIRYEVNIRLFYAKIERRVAQPPSVGRRRVARLANISNEVRNIPDVYKARIWYRGVHSLFDLVDSQPWVANLAAITDQLTASRNAYRFVHSCIGQYNGGRSSCLHIIAVLPTSRIVSTHNHMPGMQ